MNRKLVSVLSAMTLLVGADLFAQTSAPASRPRRRGRDLSELDLAGTLDFGKVPSKLMESPVDYGVYLPPGYKDPANAEKRYPIVFFLHGLHEDPGRWFGRGGAEAFDGAIKDGRLPPVIIIVPNAGYTFYSDTLDGKQPYAKFVIEELVPWADKTFRTTGTRERRLIAGNSMGGYGALKFAMQRPDLFAAVAAHSPAILPEDPDKASGRSRRTIDRLQQNKVLSKIFGEPFDLEKWKASNPIALAKSAKLEPAIGIYVDCGEDDEYEFDEGSRTFDEALTSRKIPHEFAIRPGDHGWTYIRSALPHSIKFFDTYLKTLKKP